MGAKIWIEDRNLTEEGHNVYRSTSPMDPNNMPAPYDANLPANLTEWEDGAMTPGTTYYYRVGAFTAGGTVELLSNEFMLEAVQPPYPVAAMVTHFDMSTASGNVLTDLSGTADGTITGNGALVTDATIGPALHLENAPTNTTEVVDTPTGVKLQTLTLSAVVWFKTTDTETFYLWANCDLDGKDPRGIAIANGGIFAVGRRSTASSNYEETTRFGAYADGQWHMAVFQQEGNTLRMFMDGSSTVQTQLMPSSIPAEGWRQNAILGARENLSGNPYGAGGNAFYGPHRVYDRIITPQEIDQLYSQFGGA